MQFKARLLSVLLLLVVIFLFSNCEKVEGVGGNSSISGRVIYKVYNSNFTTFRGAVPAKDEDVFILYGNSQGVSNRERTDFEGDFIFRYLYPGKYTIFLYGKDSTRTALDGLEVVMFEVDLKKNQKLDLGEIFLNKN
jgi:hypothetical protein